MKISKKFGTEERHDSGLNFSPATGGSSAEAPKKRSTRYFAGDAMKDDRPSMHLNKKDNTILKRAKQMKMPVLKREKQAKNIDNGPSMHLNEKYDAILKRESYVKKVLDSVIASLTTKLSESKSHNLDLEKVKASVSAMLNLAAKKSNSKNVALFADEAQPVHMIIQNIRIPTMNTKNYRFCLPHPLVDQFSEVCLFVPNLKKGKRIDHEETIQHYQNILEEHNVKGISQIMPLRQIEVEYDRFELKYRLVSQFDMFLADGRITGHVQGLLGKPIHKRRKLPVAVDMRAKNLKKEVNIALSKTLLMMHGRGNKASLKVGHTKQSVQQIAENIIAVAEGLAERYPGGWANIRSLSVHLQDTSPVPVYISLKNSNWIDVPVVTPSLSKEAVPVEGELSTMPGMKVTVMPSGEVILKREKRAKKGKEMGLSESDLEDLDFDDNDDEDEEEEEEMDVENSDEEPTIKEKVNVKPSAVSGEHESDTGDSDVSSVGGDEQTAEDAENSYLNKWQEQWNENLDKENERKKKRKMASTQDGVELKGEPQKKKLNIKKDETKKEKHEVRNDEVENKKMKKEQEAMEKKIKSSKLTRPQPFNKDQEAMKKKKISSSKLTRHQPINKDQKSMKKKIKSGKLTGCQLIKKDDVKLKGESQKKKPKIQRHEMKEEKHEVVSEKVENKKIKKNQKLMKKKITSSKLNRHPFKKLSVKGGNQKTKIH